MRPAVSLPLLTVTLAVLSLVPACGGSKPKPSAPPASAAPVASATPLLPAGPSLAERTSSNRRSFTLSCLAQMPGADSYCACSYQQFARFFTADDFEGRSTDPQKLAAAQASVSKECPVPEEMVRSGYTSSCMVGRKEMQAYCDCTWGEFRKRFSPDEMSSDTIVKEARFVAARPAIVKSCEKKMPEDVAKASFVQACRADDTFNAFCNCLWKEARKLSSAAEIEAGLMPLAKVKAKTDAVCSNLKPKAKPKPQGFQLEEPKVGQ